MKIGLIVDGSAEVNAISAMVQNFTIPNVQFLNAIYADMQPKATPAQIARSALGKCQILLARKVGLIVVLLDREDRNDCPSSFALAIQAAFAALGIQNIAVVIKDRQFENWLIADPDGLAMGLPARMNITPAFIRSVSPDRADLVDNPEDLLNRICIRAEYHKRHDAISIARVVDPIRTAMNSRSFRRFLRVVGFPSYQTQSRRPSDQ